MPVYQISEKANNLSKAVLDASFYIHTQLGPGLLEKVYEECLVHLLEKQNMKVERQKPVPVSFENVHIDTGFRLDLLVEDELIVELKSVEKVLPLHEAQLHTYLKLSKKDLGLLLNFNVRHFKDGIKRIGMAQKTQRSFV